MLEQNIQIFTFSIFLSNCNKDVTIDFFMRTNNFFVDLIKCRALKF